MFLIGTPRLTPPPAVLDNQDQTLVLSVSTRSNFFLMAWTDLVGYKFVDILSDRIKTDYDDCHAILSDWRDSSGVIGFSYDELGV